MPVLAYQDFLQVAAHKLSNSHHSNSRHAVLIVSFERFPALDGILGFTTVDKIMQQLSEQLKNALNLEDLVSIAGRYQISCLLVDLLTNAHAMLAAHKILRTLTLPFTLGKQKIMLAPCIGIALDYERNSTLDQLMRNASLAMHEARQEKELIKLFTEKTEDSLFSQIDLWSDLSNAIETGELHLGYQPQVNVANGKIESTEALLRWIHPQHGSIRTDKLIEVAEGTILMSRLTLWVFHTVLRELSSYRSAGLNVRVSINFSADDLRDPELTELIAQGLSIWNIPPSNITIEVTETTVMNNHAHILDTLYSLKDMGFKLSIDDFGTGYSSMARILDLPLDEIKIDKIFVRHMTTHHKHERIVDSMINLAHRLNLTVVAEGVEDTETYKRLKTLGCDVIQGYLVGKAMPLTDLIRTINNRTSSDLI